MAPSGNSQREAKSRRTGEVGSMSAPGHGQGPNGPRGPGGGSGGNPNAPPGYNELGGMGIDQRVLLEDVYGRHGPKREELADQKLMDELKKGRYPRFSLPCKQPFTNAFLRIRRSPSTYDFAGTGTVTVSKCSPVPSDQLNRLAMTLSKRRL